KELRQAVFPADLYTCALHINSMVPLIGESVAVFVLNGYSKTGKEIRRLYRGSADEIRLFDRSFFDKRILRRFVGHRRIIDFPRTPIFSLAVVPKRSGLRSGDSRRLLYSHNFQIALARTKGVVSDLETIDPKNSDAIAEKVNTARRIMEFVLKVECCSLE